MDLHIPFHVINKLERSELAEYAAMFHEADKRHEERMKNEGR